MSATTECGWVVGYGWDQEGACRCVLPPGHYPDLPHRCKHQMQEQGTDSRSGPSGS